MSSGGQGDGSDRSGVIAKELFTSLILAAVSLDDAVIDPWMQATRHGRVDFLRSAVLLTQC